MKQTTSKYTPQIGKQGSLKSPMAATHFCTPMRSVEAWRGAAKAQLVLMRRHRAHAVNLGLIASVLMHTTGNAGLRV